MIGSATTVGYFYSKATGRLRWILRPDSDAELAENPARGGEAQLLVPMATHVQAAQSGPHAMQAIVTGHTGVTPTGDRHAIVDATGNVVGTVYADPACGDAAPHGHTLVVHATAQVGGKIVGNVYTAPLTGTLPHGFVPGVVTP